MVGGVPRAGPAVDAECYGPPVPGDAETLQPRSTIYRWDLDKTYLRTEFDTLRDLLRTAFEAPEDKRVVPGAPALLRELRATGPASITILSGSPEQMRKVLEQKLRLDGIRWDDFTLKPTVRKLLRGKVRFLKDQVSYKLAALLDARIGAPPDTTEVLFGDDAEADAFIYSLYADLCAGRVGKETLLAVLERANVYRDEIPSIVRRADRLPRSDAVRRVFIHLERGSAPEVFEEFGSRVCPFHNYFQPALVLCRDGAIGPEAVLRVASELALRHRFGAEALVASAVDLCGRRHVGRQTCAAVAEAARTLDAKEIGPAATVLAELGRRLERRLPHLGDASALEPIAIDYVDLFSRDRARARAAKRRATWRRR